MLPPLAGDRVSLMKAKVLLVVVVVAAIALCAMVGPVAWEQVTTSRVWEVGGPEGEPAIGYTVINRWSGQTAGWRTWYIDSGMVMCSIGQTEAYVHYDSDGCVKTVIEGGVGMVTTPPWPCGAHDQTAPSAPWLKAGITPAEFWERVKPSGAPALEDYQGMIPGKR